MRMLLLLVASLTLSHSATSQKNNKTERQLYLTQIKAAEALLRLNETGETKKVLSETNKSLRGFEWQMLNSMADRSIQTLQAHVKPVVGIALSSDGKMLASGSADSTIILWDTDSGSKIATLTGHRGQVTSLDFDPTGKQLVSGSTDRTVKLWDIPGKKEIITIKKDFFRGIYQCKFSPDGKQIGLASWEYVAGQSPPVQGFAVILSSTNGNIIQRFNTDNHPASAIDFSGDGNKLYTATWGFYVKRHDVTTGKDDWNYDLNNIGYYAAFQSCDLSPDGKRMVTGGKDNQVRMLNATDGKLLYIIDGYKGHSKSVNAVRFSGDGKLFASASDDQLVKVWETETGKLLHSFKGHTHNINGLVFSSDNRIIFTSSSDGTIKKWNIDQPGQYHFLVCKSGPWYAPLSPDGKWMAAACLDSVLNVWNVHTKVIEQSHAGVNAIAAVISPDATYLAAANSKLHIVDLANKKIIATKEGHRGMITGVDWMKKTNFIATASGDSTIRIWDARGDSLNTITVKGGSPYSVAFSPKDNQMIAGMTNGKVKIYNTTTWKETDSLQMGTTIFNLRIDPGGRHVLTGGDKGEVWLWDLKTRVLKELKGHSNSVYGIGFHPNGKYAVTASYDLSVKFWDIETGDCMLTLKEFAGSLYTVSISDDGKLLLIGETEGQMHVYKL